MPAGLHSFFFKWDWSLNSGLCACKAVVLPLESHLQSILLCFFFLETESGEPFAQADLESQSS
jgi:hypothetical protein